MCHKLCGCDGVMLNMLQRCEIRKCDCSMFKCCLIFDVWGGGGYLWLEGQKWRNMGYILSKQNSFQGANNSECLLKTIINTSSGVCCRAMGQKAKNKKISESALVIFPRQRYTLASGKRMA